MTENTDLPQDTQIHKLVISEAYKEDALAQIKKMVKGNKYDPEHVKLESFEGEILQFQAENMMTILSKVTEKKAPGRIEGPIAVDNEHAAREEMNKAYLALHGSPDTEKKIRELLLKRDDQGFAVHNNIIPIPFWEKQFVMFEPCLTCKTTGSVKCLPCAGKGIDQCPKCNGSGMRPCTNCNGTQLVMGPNNQKVQCTICQGSGRTSCPQCNQTGTIQCRTCRSKGITQCPNCNGNAWNSNIFIMEIEARTAFDYPKDRLPEKVVAMIEKHGAKIREHADITVSEAAFSTVNIDDEEKMHEQAEADKRKDLRIPVIYDVYLPYGHIEYVINDQTYYTFLFGTKGRLTHVSPFLDDLIKNGVRKLHDASEMRGDVSENLKQAAEYRTVKEGIYYTAAHSLGKARQMLRKSNRLGLSDDMAKNIVLQADIALKNITKKPRNIGLIFSGLLNILLFATYFLSPLRAMLLANIANQNLHMLCDGGVLLAGLYLGVITIQMTSSSALKKAMHAIGIKKTPPPKLGNSLYYNAGLAIVLFLTIIETARQMNLGAPSWYLGLF